MRTQIKELERIAQESQFEVGRVNDQSQEAKRRFEEVTQKAVLL